MKSFLFKISFLAFLCFFLTIPTSQAVPPIPPPTITSFSPLSAESGTSLTISGSGFNPTASANVVYFGAVKAVVTSASSSSLTVTVPVGSTFAPITVTNTDVNLSASSPKYFQPRFSPGKQSFIDSDLAPEQVFTPGTNTVGAAIGDLDGDGKPEIVSVNFGSNNVSILQNNSTIGSIGVESFTNVGNLTTGTSPEEVRLADMNNDGKLDIVVNNSAEDNISIFLNNSTGAGNFTFAAKVKFTTGTLPRRMAIGDIDGDGILDVVTTSETTNLMSILRNTTSGGTASFATHVEFATGIQPLGVTIGDLDEDGKADIALINYLGNTVSVFRNIASPGTIDAGSLAAAQDFPVAGKPQAIAIGDIDGDSKPDIVTTYWAGSGISILPNTSSGAGNINFSSAVSFSVGSSTYWVSLGDMNGDGKLDIIASDNFAIYVIPNFTTLGNITAVSFSVKTKFQLAGAPRVFIGDLDGDGKPEIVGTNAKISILKNTLTIPTTISTLSILTATPGSSIKITGSDFDPVASNNLVYFGAAKAIPTAVTGTTELTVTVPFGAGFGPVNILNTANNTLAYSSQFFQPSFSPSKNSFSTNDLAEKLDFAAGTTPNSVNVADIDGDGKIDMVVANRTSNKISVLLNSASTGAFAAGSLNKVEIDPGVSISLVTIGDVNMDGKPDIIIAQASGSNVSVLVNTSTPGSLSFSVSPNFSVGSNITSISIADIDGDGKPDIIATLNATSSNLIIKRNLTVPGSSTISFASNNSITLSSTKPKRIAIGDLDGDGKPEIVAAFYTLNSTEGGGSKVSVLTNESIPGVIKFNSTQTLYTTGIGPYDVALGDVDGDGKLDIVTSNLANGSGNTVSVLRNTGAGFASFESLPTGNQPKGIALADMNGDAKPEIITSNIDPTSNSISVLNNNSTSGSLAFSTHVDFATGVLPNVLVVNDLDSDGKPEIITANYTDNKLSVFKNTLVIPAPTISSFIPSSAKIGATVTITGTDFLAATSVKFGGVEAASYSVVSPTNITAVLASGSSGDISIITPSGTGTLAGFSFISSDATLTSISLSSGTLSPAFASGTLAYTASVINLVSSITVTPTLNDANATLKVNGTTVVSGNASTSIPLNIGTNEITVLVTAQDGSTQKTYTITITRTPSADATLASISLSSGTLSPAFASGTLAYTASVINSVSSITITPTLNDANAILKVNGTAVVSGNASTSIPLNIGTNEITVLVTAQDGSTTKSYTLTINRETSANADLASLSITGGSLNPAFNSGITAYTMTLANSISAITITTTASNTASSIKINGLTATGGSSSGPYSMMIGENTIAIEVKAGDGTLKTYTIRVSREPDPVVNVTLNNANNNVQVSSPTAQVTVNIATGTTSPLIDYSALLNSGVAQIPETNINSNLAKITIPGATTIKGSTLAWNGILSGPRATSYDLPKVPGEITTTGIAIEVGDPDVSLSFDRGVRILLVGQAGMRVAWVHQNIYTEISTVGSADSQAAADLLPANGAFKVNVGSDLVIWTKGFSRFITFSQSVDLNVAIVAADRAALNADAIKGANADLNHITSSLINPLPSIGSGGSQITWTSDNSSVLSSEGKLIARPVFGSPNSIVNLIATIRKGGITETKSFALSVMPLLNQAPTLSAIPDQTICFTSSPQMISLIGLSPGSETAQTITLSVSSDNPSFFSQLKVDDVNKKISYIPANALGGTARITVTVKDNGGVLNGGLDTFSRTFSIRVNSLPNISLSSSLGNEISKGQLTILSADSGVSYVWSDDNGLIAGQNNSTLNIRPEVSTRYTVKATNAAGCVSSANIFIQVLEDYNALEMNNLISPNGDGYNDALVIRNLDMYPMHTLRIFDRAGRILYQKQNYQNDWTGTFQGKPLTEGTYYYTLEFDSGKKVIKGFVSIVN